MNTSHISDPPTAPDTPRWSEMLNDKTRVLIRPMRSRDRAAEIAFIEGLSMEARRYRFLGQFSTPSEALVERLTHADFIHDIAFVAVVPEDGHERIIGTARFSVDPDGMRCECAVTVADAWQQRGLGTNLMRHLIDVARAMDLRVMYSIDSADNVKMRDLAAHLGFRSRLDPEDPSQYIHTLDLTHAPAQREAQHPMAG